MLDTFTTHTRSMSSPCAQNSFKNHFALDSSHDEHILAIPRTTHSDHRQRAHRSVDSLRVLPPLVTQSARPGLSSISRPPLSAKPNPPPANPPGAISELNKTGVIRGVLADWFQGESKPLSLSILPYSAKEMDAMETITLSPPSETISQIHEAPQSISKPPVASRFSFFSSKPSAQKPAISFDDPTEELLNLNVTQLLLCNDSSDPPAPVVHTNQIQNVKNLVSRLQTALKESRKSLHEMRLEKEAQAEELDGSEIRAKHLKIQLDDVTTKLAEQDAAMMNLVDELAQEKQLRRDEEYARKRSILLVKTSRVESTARGIGRPHDGSPLAQKSRSSIVSDSGFESEDESSLCSVSMKYQGVASPVVSTSSFSTAPSPDVPFQPEFAPQLERLPTQCSRPKAPPQKLSTFQNVIKGFSGKPRNDESAALGNHPPTPTRSNCSEVHATEAWNIVNLLKEENQALKRRLDFVEGALDGCLDEVVKISQ